MIGGPDSIVGRLVPGAAVAVIRLRSMGDTVLTTPALALLKSARPDLRIFVVLERPWDRLLESNPDVAGVIVLEGSARWKTLAALRGLRPALCLNLHGGSTSAWLTALSGARWRAGFAHFQFQPVYNAKIPRAQEILGRPSDAPVHTAEHLAAAMFCLGVEPQEIPAARLFAEAAPARSPYAVLHLGAAYFTKQWAPERFAELARWLRREQGLEPILLAGPGEGRLLAEMKEFRSFDNLSLGEMMALLKGAELFVGNDSGPAHVAAAFGVPCVVIFGSSNSRVWHPWRTRYEVVETARDCKPCPGDRCYAFDRPRCILSVEVEPVRQAVLSLLRARSAVERH
ncbi:MAG TPA: glycosyltransferase family 9 protein [Bryobacterales bacterium]|nr:glycosyltransferase family 9 protein [Bryobacterales bacterium]